ncbi:hypothetical protein J421_3742 [Gemmatirosa kalamazoonensis]|uniref:Uncharacterized protein n=1 Tax=Gemmatirosa kalamazoonensis TaxID=861299 RepID=W0RJM6_9BACT|nr:hypothetical protein [Gemmatirosa kalamazoonensis]AHG91279.1 hypothetical protein J421_3742 [Gemmatirosa kalamazoonensis]
MEQREQQSENDYPHGRGYGHDYMRGGEVFGGYGYSERPEYARRRGESDGTFDLADSGERRRASDSIDSEGTDG